MELPGRVRLPAGAADMLDAHARAQSPREACGLLIGRFDGPLALVDALVPARNVSCGNDVYELAPEDFVAADAAAEARGLAVVGFYHSHPRGPRQMSAVDRARAWTRHVYLLIVPETLSGSELSAWILGDETAGFEPLAIDFLK